MGHERQLSLDAVRGFAILLVLTFHLPIATGAPAIDALIAPVARAGWAGVDLFFVLSGFLVGRMILVEAARPGGFDPRRFFVRRMWRLWPALYAYLAVFVAIGGGDVAHRALPVLFHLQNYSGDTIDHLWSLAVEEHFYLVSAFALPWLARGGDPRRLIAALLAVMLASLVLRIGAVADGASPIAIQWGTQYRIDALACGVLLAAVQLHYPAAFISLARRRGPLMAIAASGFAILVIGDSGAFRHGIGFTIAYLAAAALILATCEIRMTTPGLALRWLASLGTIAYSLYIWHASIGPVGVALARAAGVTVPLMLTAACYAAAIGWAWLAYRLIERPMMALRNPSMKLATAT